MKLAYGGEEIPPAEKVPEVREIILTQIRALADSDYKAFNDKIAVPTRETLGVRVPLLRKIAKRLARKDWQAYADEIEAACNKDDAVFFEEVVVWGMTIGYADIEEIERFAALDRFIVHIQDWGTVDLSVVTCKFMATSREQSWDYLQKWARSSREFEVRFALVSYLTYFLDDDYIDRVLVQCSLVAQQDYYVKMAIAWLVSMAFVVCPEVVEAYLREGCLDAWTHNKTLQKIRESRQVSPVDKTRLSQLKRSIDPNIKVTAI